MIVEESREVSQDRSKHSSIICRFYDILQLSCDQGEVYQSVIDERCLRRARYYKSIQLPRGLDLGTYFVFVTNIIVITFSYSIIQ